MKLSIEILWDIIGTQKIILKDALDHYKSPENPLSKSW